MLHIFSPANVQIHATFSYKLILFIAYYSTSEQLVVFMRRLKRKWAIEFAAAADVCAMHTTIFALAPKALALIIPEQDGAH